MSTITEACSRMIKGVACSGAIIYDVIVRPIDQLSWGTTKFVDSLEYHVGGNGSNTSIALAILGVPTRLFGTVGHDPQGEMALQQIRNAGVDVRFVNRAQLPTATTVVLVNEGGERQFLHRLGANRQAFAEPLHFTAELTEGVSHYHLASLFILPRLRAHASAMLCEARSVGLKTSMDTNWDPEGRWIQDLEPCLPHLDFLFMNEDEARKITGSSDPAIAARVVRSGGVRTAVMKLGRRGCAIYTGDREILCPAFSVEVKDTTGAGDCFVAGFLCALQRGDDLEAAGQFANAVGALTVRKIGAVAGVLPRRKVEEWMRSPR